LGVLKREWIKRTGLPAGVKVYCGLHDSNAALLAARSIGAMAARDSTVLSTGTWFVAMRSPLLKSAAQTMRLPETRDCLVNVDVEGAPIPSARFMGGREIEVLMDAEHAGTDQPSSADASDPEEGRSLKQCEHALRVAEAGELIVPSAVPGVGPFPNAKRGTLGPISDIDQAIAKSHLYAALVADVSLDLIGSCDTLLVDGRFSRSAVFVSALAALRPDTAVLVSKEEHGVARGALRLVSPHLDHSAQAQLVAPLPIDLSAYRARWRDAANLLG
jgi:sugar (pentulose or hexulose) kinase